MSGSPPERPSPSQSTEPSADWIARLRAGDPSAGEWVEQQYRPALVRLCLGYLGDQGEAEDAVQDVLAKVLASRVVPDRFRTWLYATARNHCLNLLRSRRRHATVPLPSTTPIAATQTGFLSKLVRAESQARLVEAFASLSVDEQEALRLRYAEQLARDEIAEITGVPPSTVKSRLFAGLQKLRSALG
ncbi:MAG: sigma-70 family RNA polymerase sigma factor [Planctomycetota bacterium]